MTDDFSDKPLTVDGVTVTPKWAWSDAYRREVRETIRATGRSDLSPMEQRRRYAKWYAEKHGLSLEEAIARLNG